MAEVARACRWIPLRPVAVADGSHDNATALAAASESDDDDDDDDYIDAGSSLQQYQQQQQEQQTGFDIFSVMGTNFLF